MSLFAELQRRNVIRVAIFYIVSSWLVLQIADLVFELLLVPDWTLRFIFGVLLVAFPFVLFIAWAYEMTPEGLKREADVDRSASVTHETGRKLNVAVGVVAMAAIALLAWDRLAPREDAGTATASDTPAAETSAPGSATPESGAPAAAEAATADVGIEPDDGVSIAVLPFANTSGNPDNEYFSDGLTDTLLHVLSKVPELRVAARTSSFEFKGGATNVGVIGQRLKVAHVLEGSVQRAGNRVRITAQLVKTDNGYQLWSETYDRTLDDIFEVQDEIAGNVVESLASTLLGELPTADVIDPAIFDDFLRAQALVYGKDADEIERAIALLDSIVSRAPDFARGHALLAEAYQEKFTLTETNWDEARPQAEAAALRAVELDPEEADAWLALAGVRRWQQNYAAMLEHLERALALEPNGARVLAEYASGLRRLNRFDESLPITRRAVLLDPLNPVLKQGLGEAYFFANRYEEAEAIWLETLELSPDEPRILLSLGNLYYVLGRWGESLTLAEQMLTANPRSFWALERLHDLYMGAGDLETADLLVERMLEASEARALNDAAQVCLLRGDRECWLEYMRRRAEAVGAEPDDEARLAYVAGDLEAATALMQQDVARELEMGESRIGSRRELAALHQMRGELDAVAELARIEEESFRVAMEQGLRWNYLTQYLPATRAAMKGDAREAARLASIANREGPPITLFMMQDFIIWDVIRETPEFEALMVEVRERQAEMLAEMRAVATWDPREN